MARTRAVLAVIVALAVVATPCVASAALAASAQARTLHTVLEDDTLSLYAPPQLPGFTAELRWLGVDELRVSAEWALEAPSPNSPRRPDFEATDPRAYTSAGMTMLDRAVRAAAGSGLHVIVDPAFSAPRWATSNRRPSGLLGQRWYNTNIDVGAMAAWEVMLARRYSGTFTPAGERSPLPRVDTFTLWNEPNERGFLAPQWSHGVPVSADWYRRLVDAVYPAIKRVAPWARVLIGNTSAAGADAQTIGGGVPPLIFIRRLACVDSRLRPVHDGGCAHFRPVPADGYSQHPYERDAPPWVASPNASGWAQMGDLEKLQRLLDRLVAMHRLAPGASDLWLTEQGYGSNGQLPEVRWNEAQQAVLNATSEYLAWRDPQLQSFSQFLLRDTLTQQTLALRRRTGRAKALVPGTWTTGLERELGPPKPALSLFRSPVVARILPAGSESGSAPTAMQWLGLGWGLGAPSPRPMELEVWGRARPVRSPTLISVETVDGRPGGSNLVRYAATDANGIFDVRIFVSAATPVAVRFGWVSATGWQFSPFTLPLAFPLP